MTLPVSGERVQPSLYIGLGTAGVRCLELIQRQMPASLAAGVRLLGIRLSVSGGATELDPENLIQIQWDRDKARRLGEADGRYRWWLDHDGGFQERLDARIAFHIMRHFERDARLPDYLRRTAQSLALSSERPLMLYVIASLREAEVAFLGDLAVDVLKHIGPQRVAVRLPCLLAGTDRREGQTRSSWVIAGLREIERLMQKLQVPLGSPSEDVLDNELFSRILLTEDERHLPALADQLVALMEQDAAQKFANDYGNTPLPSRFSMTISRSFTYQVPVEDIRRVSVARLLKEELFEAVSMESWLHLLSKDFLMGSEINRPEWKAFRRLADILEHKKPSETETRIIQRYYSYADAFREELCRFLNSGPMGKGNLKEAVRFFEILEKDIVAAIEEDARMGRTSDLSRQQLPGLKSVIHAFTNAASGCIQTWNSLGSRVEQLYRQAGREMQVLKQPTVSRHIVLHPAPEDHGEDPYYLELKSRPEAWQGLVEDIRNLVRWDWMAPPGQFPYLRCLIGGTAYSEVGEMLQPLWRQASLLAGQVAEKDSVFAYLGRFSAHQIRETFENAPKSLEYDPHPSEERRFCQYLVCTGDPMIHSWNLNTGIQVCTTSDDKRLTYLAFEHNLPVVGAHFLYKTALYDHLDNEIPFAFPHEQHAWKVERKMKEHKKELESFGIRMEAFPAQFVRLMHKPDDFETAMQCVFRGRIVQSGQQWLLNLGNERAAVTLSYEQNLSVTIEEALVNFIIRIPLQDVGGLHPLCKPNFSATMALLRKRIANDEKTPRPERAGLHDHLKKNIETWINSPSPFERGLAMYQAFLLVQDYHQEDAA